MASGWANDDSVNQQIKDSIADEITRIRNNMPSGVSFEFCEECDRSIPEARRLAVQGVRLCIHCQEELDGTSQRTSVYNRKGSKDSQLR